MEKSRVYPWLLVGMLWCICLLNYADRQAIFSVFTPIKSEFGLSDIQLAWLASAFMWVYAITGPGAGWVADRFSRKRVILGALAFWSCVTAAVSLVHGYHFLVLLRALSGLGEAFYFPAAMSLLESYHGHSTRSRAMAIHQTATYVGVFVGGTVSAVIAQHYGWRLSFSVFGLAGVVLALILWVTIREPEIETPSDETTDARTFLPMLQRTFLHGPTMIQIGAFFCANFVAMVFLTWLPTHLQRNYHLDLASAGFNSTFYMQLASLVGVLVGGFVSDRWRRSTLSARLRMQAIGMALAVPFLFSMGWAGTVRTLVICLIGFGFGKGIYEANLWASLYDVVPRSRKGISAGLMNSIGWVGGGIAPVTVAALAGHLPLAACLAATSALYAADAVVFLQLSRHQDALATAPSPAS